MLRHSPNWDALLSQTVWSACVYNARRVPALELCKVGWVSVGGRMSLRSALSP